jgi:hypothetical protein
LLDSVIACLASSHPDRLIVEVAVVAGWEPGICARLVEQEATKNGMKESGRCLSREQVRT